MNLVRTDGVCAADDYSLILSEMNIAYTEHGDFLYSRVGISQVDWVIYVSVALPRLSEILFNILPTIVKWQIDFRIVKNWDYGQQILDGSKGEGRIGKLISVYPKSNVEADKLFQFLKDASISFTGPLVRRQYQLSDCVFAKRVTSDNSSWPFSAKRRMSRSTMSTILARRYFMARCLKNDTKGKVYLAYSVDFPKLKKSVIKEGQIGMCSDAYGRDIQDRLRKQYELHKILAVLIPSPQPYEIFEHNSALYLSMEYLDGTTLGSVIKTIYANKKWKEIDVLDKNKLIDYVIQIIDAIQIMHQSGLVHRDICPDNFIVNKIGIVSVIDFELTFDLRSVDEVPYQLGTIGYISENQYENGFPSFVDDIYAIGALLLHVFTGFSPIKFGYYRLDNVMRNILYHVGDSALAGVICKSISDNPNDRPSLDDIRFYLKNFDSSVKEIDAEVSSEEQKKNFLKLASSIFTAEEFFDSHGFWYSTERNAEESISNRQFRFGRYIGLYKGISGVLYTICEAVKCGVISEDLSLTFNKHFEYIINNVHENGSGLYYGSAGVPQLLHNCVQAGVISQADFTDQIVDQCYSEYNPEVDLENGIAGQGLSIINSDLFFTENGFRKLNEYAEIVLNKQGLNGSWGNNGQRKQIGYQNGDSGIIYFLLKAYSVIKSDRLHAAAQKGVKYVINELKTAKKVRSSCASLGFDFQSGISGISLMLSEASIVFSDETVLSILRELMDCLPENVGEDLSFNTGAAGVAAVNFHVGNIIREPAYINRYKTICRDLIHLCRYTKDGVPFWVVKDNMSSTLDFMDGNSGILRTLLLDLNVDLKTKCARASMVSGE